MITIICGLFALMVNALYKEDHPKLDDDSPIHPLRIILIVALIAGGVIFDISMFLK